MDGGEGRGARIGMGGNKNGREQGVGVASSEGAGRGCVFCKPVEGCVCGLLVLLFFSLILFSEKIIH